VQERKTKEVGKSYQHNMTFLEIYVLGAILVNVMYFRQVQSFAQDISELEAESSFLMDVVRGMSTTFRSS